MHLLLTFVLFLTHRKGAVAFLTKKGGKNSKTRLWYKIMQEAVGVNDEDQVNEEEALSESRVALMSNFQEKVLRIYIRLVFVLISKIYCQYYASAQVVNRPVKSRN